MNVTCGEDFRLRTCWLVGVKSTFGDEGRECEYIVGVYSSASSKERLRLEARILKMFGGCSVH